jgi:hypothetical protein
MYCLEEGLDQKRDVAAPLAQRRQVDWEHADAVVKVLAESPINNHLLQGLEGERGCPRQRA